MEVISGVYVAMSGRGWIKVAIFSFFLLAVTGLGIQYLLSKKKEYAADRNDIANQSREYVDTRIDMCADPHSFITWLTCAYESEGHGSDYLTSQKSLKAQHDMSVWALGMLIASTATFLVSTFGIFFVWLTLKKTEDTNRYIAAQFDSDNPPIFEIKQIRLDLRKWLCSDKREGGLWVFNSGTTTAKIHHSNVVFHAGKTPPVARPFEHAKHANQILEKGSTFRSGKGVWAEFTDDGCLAENSDIKAALDASSPINFYIIGRILYRAYKDDKHYRTAGDDKADWTRHRVFCRVYDPKTDRFVETNDADYEYGGK